jgi:ABC-2 type transport system ATP-binding protein
MSEMALTADRLVVIGRGRLIAEQPVAEFIAANSSQSVMVRSPRGEELARVLDAGGGQVASQPDGGLIVTGIGAPAIGDLAAGAGIAVHELTPQVASLEEAFMELTQDSVEFGAHQGGVPVAAGAGPTGEGPR